MVKKRIRQSMAKKRIRQLMAKKRIRQLMAKKESKEIDSKEESKEIDSKEESKEIDSQEGAAPISLKPETNDNPIALEDTETLVENQKKDVVKKEAAKERKKSKKDMFRCGKGCGGFNSWMKHNTPRFAARALKFVSLAVRPVVATTSSFSKRVSRFSSSFSSSSSSAFSSSSSSLGASAFGSIFGHKKLFHSPGFHQSFKAQSAKWIGKGSSIQSHYSQYCTGGSGCTTKSSCSKQNYQYTNGEWIKQGRRCESNPSEIMVLHLATRRRNYRCRCKIA